MFDLKRKKKKLSLSQVLNMHYMYMLNSTLPQVTAESWLVKTYSLER